MQYRQEVRLVPNAGRPGLMCVVFCSTEAKVEREFQLLREDGLHKRSC